jgi:hypothetical protein
MRLPVATPELNRVGNEGRKLFGWDAWRIWKAGNWGRLERLGTLWNASERLGTLGNAWRGGEGGAKFRGKLQALKHQAP